MDNPKIEAGAWVLVCDGRKALILRNAGDATFPNLQTKETHSHPNASTREQGASPPGRSYQSVGSSRSAVDQTDWHDEAERTFLKSLAARLDKAVTSGETETMTIVAPPRALGMMRPLYSAALKRAIVGEVQKDLIKVPVHEIENMLTRSGALG